MFQHHLLKGCLSFVELLLHFYQKPDERISVGAFLSFLLHQ